MRWIETQLAARQRRVDRALVAKIGDDIHLQHIEWTERLTHDVYVRVYEYNHLLVMAAHQDANERSIAGKPRVKPASVDSVVVVLRGRRKSLPEFGFYRTSSTQASFSGVRFRIEAIYLRTVAEIESMGSAFWLVFVPLAVDVDDEALIRVIHSLKARTNAQDFADFIATMICVARLRKDHPNFLDVISSEERRQIMFTNEWLVLGRREGRKEGRKEGRDEGREEARQERERLLLGMFERRLGRSLTAIEQVGFTSWLSKRNGAKNMANAVIDLSAEELAARLSERRTSRQR